MLGIVGAGAESQNREPRLSSIDLGFRYLLKEVVRCLSA